jgi:outer membrane protein
MKKIKLCAAALILGVAMTAGAAEVITLADFIDKSAAANPDIFAELTKISESDALERQAKSIHDIVFNLHYYRMFDKPFSEYSSVKTREMTTDNIGANLQWVAPYLGTRLKGGVEYFRNRLTVGLPDQSPPFGSIDRTVKYYNPEMFFEIQHPLLRNWFGILDEFPVKQAKLNGLIIRETVNESIEMIVTDLYNLYFDWYSAYNQYRIFSKNVENSETLVKQTNSKFRSGLSDRSDVSRTKILNIEYKKSRDLTGARLQNVKRKIYTWYTGPKSTVEEPDIVPEQSIEIQSPSSQNFSIDSTRQMKILRLTKEVLKARLSKEENEMLPNLNFILSYRMRNYTANKDKYFSDLDYNTYTVGAVLSYPIFSDMSRGKVKEVESRLKKWDSDVRSFERGYAQTFEELKKILAIYDRLLEYDRSLIEQAAIQLREEEKKYQQGRSDLFFVVQYRNALLNYELIQLRDYIEARTVKIQTLALMDQLKK